MIPVVLLVEEQSALRDRYAQYLRNEGYEVVTAAGVEELASLASRVAPNAIVLDPECDNGGGYQAALSLLNSGSHASLVFNTSHAFDLENDFSNWVADEFANRDHGVGELGRVLRRVLPVVADVGSHF
jgi:DNA-binding response OmpR family regulator